jgi:hypothetical protein
MLPILHIVPMNNHAEVTIRPRIETQTGLPSPATTNPRVCESDVSINKFTCL